VASKNTTRQFDVDSYYHIYNRGVEKRDIFIDDEDRVVFLSMLKRHLSPEIYKDSSGRPYTQYPEIELLAFCLMNNHYHLLIFQKDDPQAFSKFLRSIGTAYTGYFNRKYKRVGHLFQERFKASKISNDVYLQHISRYIHLNPSQPFDYKWSSLAYYLEQKSADWLHPERLLEGFHSPKEYEQFIQDYTANKKILDELKSELADS